ncbi:MAG: acetylxylan esterase, partial [Planctomycetota bacterium]
MLPKGKVPNDVRHKPPKDLNGYFPFHAPETVEDWEERAADLKRRTLVATGLWPMPPTTPLRPMIRASGKRDGFTIEKVHFESYPGHHVTGLLFRPTKKHPSGKHPAVLSPHGHGGRLQDHGKSITDLIKQGRERYEGSGRFPKVARCAHLARMGCVVFLYDMLGYADSKQISYQLAHRFAKQRPDFESETSWGLYSAQAEMRLQSIFGVQTYNSLRALDFLTSLTDVDETRVGITGGSGGGTQTILLGALDPRPIVSFPQGMVSTSMQGGCTCENVCLMRVGSGNVELTALFAPKPIAMTAANDWTKAMMSEGYPQLQKLYSLYVRKDNVYCKDLRKFPHNYNYVTRAEMYAWFNRYLKLDLTDLEERDFAPLTSKEHAVWDEDHPAPPSGDPYERKLTKQLADISDRQLRALEPRDAASFEEYRHIVGGALQAIVGRKVPEFGSITREQLGRKEHDSHVVFTDLLRNENAGEEIPLVSLFPKAKFSGKVTLWLHGEGKSGLFDSDGAPKPYVANLLGRGVAVLCPDLFGQGEHLKDGEPI